ncbi:hypothetical protein BST61_g11605 [Cercospora zeina]
MGWNPWVQFTFHNDSASPQDTVRLSFPDIGCHWGRRFKAGDVESREQIFLRSSDGTDDPPPGESIAFGQTGLPKYVDGIVGYCRDLYSGEEKIVRGEDSCPWSGSNEVKVTRQASDWEISESGWARQEELGYVTFRLQKKG